MRQKSVQEHIKIASERASTNPEVATANALAAIAILLAYPPQPIMLGVDQVG